jgi:sec-independent protein translocase protein TatC
MGDDPRQLWNPSLPPLGHDIDQANAGLREVFAEARHGLERPSWVRLRICLGALVVALLLAIEPLPWSPESSPTLLVVRLVAAPADGHLLYVKPDEGFRTYAKMAMLLTFVIAQPTILWQIFDALAPASLPQRYRRIHLAVLLTVGAFFAGAAVAYAILLPVAMQYLLSWGDGINVMGWQFSEYMSAVSWMLVWFGLAFELTLLVVSLAWLRICGPGRMASYRRFVLLLVFILAAWVTPTPDPPNQTIVAVPCYLLYELGLLLARLVPTGVPRAV